MLPENTFNFLIFSYRLQIIWLLKLLNCCVCSTGGCLWWHNENIICSLTVTVWKGMLLDYMFYWFQQYVGCVCGHSASLEGLLFGMWVNIKGPTVPMCDYCFRWASFREKNSGKAGNNVLLMNVYFLWHDKNVYLNVIQRPKYSSYVIINEWNHYSLWWFCYTLNTTIYWVLWKPASFFLYLKETIKKTFMDKKDSRFHNVRRDRNGDCLIYVLISHAIKLHVLLICQQNHIVWFPPFGAVFPAQVRKLEVDQIQNLIGDNCSSCFIFIAYGNGVNTPHYMQDSFHHSYISNLNTHLL